jgi:hypothetical protein
MTQELIRQLMIMVYFFLLFVGHTHTVITLYDLPPLFVNYSDLVLYFIFALYVCVCVGVCARARACVHVMCVCALYVCVFFFPRCL